MVEDEASHFTEHFAAHGSAPHQLDAIAEVVLPLHAEALEQLTQIANDHHIHGTNEYKRSVALQIALDSFDARCKDNADSVLPELHLAGGTIKPRPLIVFKDTLDGLSKLERELHCSETILLETAIRQAAEARAVELAAT
jgi:hypothetical protein